MCGNSPGTPPALIQLVLRSGITTAVTYPLDPDGVMDVANVVLGTATWQAVASSRDRMYLPAGSCLDNDQPHGQQLGITTL